MSWRENTTSELEALPLLLKLLSSSVSNGNSGDGDGDGDEDKYAGRIDKGATTEDSQERPSWLKEVGSAIGTFGALSSHKRRAAHKTLNVSDTDIDMKVFDSVDSDMDALVSLDDNNWL